MDEMARAIAGLKDGKAPGGDGIPAEVWKHGGDNLFSWLHQLITNAWEVGSVPQAWKDASIVTIYKKGDRTGCGNYRGISLLSIAGKIFTRILLNRLSTYITPEVVPETQCGFSTVDDILSPTATRKVHWARPTTHRTWYLSTSVRHSLQLGGPGCGSYWGSMDAQRSSQLWSRLYIPEWWRMLLLEGKSRNRSVLQMGSNKVVYWHPCSFPSS